VKRCSHSFYQNLIHWVLTFESVLVTTLLQLGQTYFFFRMAAVLEEHNERNFLLLYRLLLHSTPVLLAKFEKSLIDQGTTLQTWQPTGRDLKEAKLSNTQISNLKQRRTENFDVVLLIYLLRNFGFKSEKNNLLWNETDNNKIQTTGDIANIVMIRNLRNTVCVLFCT